MRSVDRLDYRGAAFDAAVIQVTVRVLAPPLTCAWVVYSKHPFAESKAMLEYLSRDTHRLAISNQRLVAFNERGVTRPRLVSAVCEFADAGSRRPTSP